MRRSPLPIAATILALPVLFSSPLVAQTAAPDPETVPSLGSQLRGQWTSADVPMRSESRESLRTRDATVDRLTLREAVVAALENNPGIAVERLGPRFARAGIAGAYGLFDPTFTAFGEVNRLVEPTGSALAGAEVVRTREIDFGARIEKLIRTGARLAIEYDSNELRQNSSFLGLRPQYRPELSFSVSQPLLRDFGLGLTVLLVRSAEARSGAAFHEYRTRVSALVLDVVRAYWEVVRTRELLAAERDGLRLARTLEKENEARVRAGVLPPIAVREAAADSAAREERVILAENALDVAADRLRLLVQRNPDRAFLPRRIEPADSPDVREVETDEEAILEAAVLSRPELLRARHEVQNQEILARARRNNLLPSLDLRGSYGLNGLSGRAVPQIDFATGETVTTRFGGNYADALDRLFGGEYESYSAGVELSVPIGNSAAESEYVQSQIDLRRSELAYRQLVSDVTLEVRTAVANVAANSKRITATRLARELAVENLEQQKKRYEVGLATTKDILDFQEDVTAARAAETGALIDYNVSLAALRRAEGSLLERFDVVVDALEPHPGTFWSKF
jgi:outer membrane protein